MPPMIERAFAGKRILVVDDQHLVTTLLTHVATALGFAEVVCVHEGKEALALLQNETFAAVLSDIKMEPMSGLHLIAAIRKESAHAALPVILMTSDQDPNLVLGAKRLGANGFLIKPFKPETLRDQLLRILPVG